MKNINFVIAFVISIISNAQNEILPTYDFSTCPNGKYKKCFKKIKTPRIFNFDTCANAKSVRQTFSNQISNYIATNMDSKLKKAVLTNNTTKSELPYLSISYWVNDSGKIEADLMGSNIPRNSNEYKKLQFLFSKIKLNEKMFPHGKPPFNSQLKTLLKFNKSDDSKLLTYKQPNLKKWIYKIDDSLTVPLYKGCHRLKDKFTEETFKAEKVCMHHYLSKLITSKVNKDIVGEATKKLKERYSIYNAKCYINLSFSFSKNGVPENPEVISIFPQLEKEVLRLFKFIPKAIEPATKKGKNQRMEFFLPIVFKIDDYRPSIKP